MSTATDKRIYVWDLPTRIFHWALLVLVLVAWFTGEEKGAAAVMHRYAGEAIAGFIVFRVIWGFVGGEHARFADFAAGPVAIITHVSDLFSKEPKRHLGHNPLGGLAVFLLLAVVAGVVVTGLFSGDEGNAGPFSGLWGVELSELHEVLFRVLQGLVAIHILGVVIETVLAKDALVPAMITGAKRRRAQEPGEDAKRAGWVAFALALTVGIAASAALMIQPAATGTDTEVGQEDHEPRYRGDLNDEH